MIDYILTPLGQGYSLVYYDSDYNCQYANGRTCIGFGFDSLNYKGEEVTRTTNGRYKKIAKVELSTYSIYVKIHPYLIWPKDHRSKSFYMQAGIAKKDFLWEKQWKRTSDNGNTGKFVAKNSDFGYLFGLGWNWITDFGFSFTIVLSSITVTDPDYEYVEEHNYLITEYGKESWEKEVQSSNYGMLPVIKVGWMF